jgi:hypothetical protein
MSSDAMSSDAMSSDAMSSVTISRRESQQEMVGIRRVGP